MRSIDMIVDAVGAVVDGVSGSVGVAEEYTGAASRNRRLVGVVADVVGVVKRRP